MYLFLIEDEYLLTSNVCAYDSEKIPYKKEVFRKRFKNII